MTTVLESFILGTIEARANGDLLSQLCPGPPVPLDYDKIPIGPTTLIFTVTLRPTAINPNELVRMEDVLYNQRSRFSKFIRKNTRGMFYYVTERQKNGNYHWHGFVNVDSILDRDLLVHKMKRTFGRSEIVQPHSSYRHWYNYIHKEALYIDHNIG